MTKLDKFNPTTSEDIKEQESFLDLNEEERWIKVGKAQERAFVENIDSFGKMLERENDPEKQEEFELALKICKAVKERGGIALVVGGFARDAALAKFGYNLKPKDIDLEVYGVEQDVLREILERLGRVEITGEAFMVFKLRTDKMSKSSTLDISIPRRDSKTGKGHKGFKVEGDPNMLIKEAARRRDFTINALALDPLTGQILDFYGGIEDIKIKTLRVTDEKLFGDDSLRVLRGAQFAGRFGFDIDPKTAEICRSLDLTDLPKERIGEEWLKLLMKSDKPSIGLEAMFKLGVLDKLHPEVKALIGVLQSPKYHPEGDVWTHTKLVVDAAAQIAKEQNLNDENKLVLMLSALCHDFGKPVTTKTEDDGRITSHEHETKGLPIAENFLKLLNINQDLIKKILLLIADHMTVHLHRGKSLPDTAIRRLARRLYPATIRELADLATANVRGSLRVEKEYPEAEALAARAEKLAVKDSKPAPLIMGRDLLEIGFKQGIKVGEVLREIGELQIEGKITNSDEAKNYARVFYFLNSVERRQVEPIRLLNGEFLSKEEMIDFIKSRFIWEKVHDMGTLVMTLILKGENLPEILAKNKEAILTAHKLGPIWFSRLDKNFYNTSWKSFYGLFEASEKEIIDRLKAEIFEEQTRQGLGLVNNVDGDLIAEYDKIFNIKPVEFSGKFALYNTDQYPFEAGMFEGYRIMVQYQPERKRMAISVLDEDPEKVKEIDQKIRKLLPQFEKARKIGYLFAQNEEGEDNVFSFNDAKKVYDALVSSF